MITVALGGLGADSHTVGLLVLRRALDAAGFRVVDLGIQNDFQRFAAAAEFCDAVLVSSMDGHAEYYLSGLKALPQSCVWYLGGHLGPGCEAEPLRQLGFRRVYTRFVEASEVVDRLRRDLPMGGRNLDGRVPPRPPSTPEVTGRTAVLGQWPTGAGAANLEDNAAFLAERPSLATLQAAAATPLLQPRSGVAEPRAQRELFGKLLAAGSQVLSFQVDSLTRDGRYDAVEVALARRGGLNGFPLVNHGVDAVRRITEAIPVPIQTRHSARDPRLLAEISFAGGVTAFEGGPICYNLPYYADVPVATSIARWQYVDELTARYAGWGIVLDREFFGTLTGTLIPPWLAITTDLLEGLLAVAEGVRSVSLAYAEQGCRVQDIAAIRVLRRLGDEMLGRQGAVRVATVFHQFMGAFPSDREDAEALIEASAQTAAMAGADRILLKASCEAIRIPDAAANMRSLDLAARAMARNDEPASEPAIALEEALIEATVRALLEAIRALKPGDLAGSIVAAFRHGILDIPFSPSCHNAGRLLTARDHDGAIRVLERGAVPIPDEVRRFDAERMAMILSANGIAQEESWKLVVDDVMRAARGPLRWPLDGSARRPIGTAERGAAPC